MKKINGWKLMTFVFLFITVFIVTLDIVNPVEEDKQIDLGNFTLSESSLRSLVSELGEGTFNICNIPAEKCVGFDISLGVEE